MAEETMKDVARWDSTGLLAKVAREHFEQFLAEKAEAEKRMQIEPTSEDNRLELEYNYGIHEDKAFNHALVVVAFCAFALEAHINEYGSRRLGSSYYERFLDKLDTVSKWIVVPRLVCGKELPRDGQSFHFLTSLFRWRNTIAHPKAKDVQFHDLSSDVESRNKNRREFIAFVSSSVPLLDELAETLRILDPQDPLLGVFLSPESGSQTGTS